MPKTINFVKVRVPEGFVVGRDRIDPHNVYGPVETEEAVPQWSAFRDNAFDAICLVASPAQWQSVRRLVEGVLRWPSTPADGSMLDELLHLIAEDTGIVCQYVDDEGWRAFNQEA